MGFRKTGSNEAVRTEVASLAWLQEADGAAVAEVLGSGPGWLETRMMRHGDPSRDEAVAFGQALARTHASGAPHWGAPPPGLPESEARLAELPAPAATTPRWDSWGEFFAEARLLPYLRLTHGDPSSKRLLAKAIDVVGEGRFDSPQPALVPAVARLHGDLWGGNVVWEATPTGTVGTLIDPSAHGGHAETDLAELALFGAPHLAAILDGYQEVSPLADGWQHRRAVHQFHMVLVHCALFGGGYLGQALSLARVITR
ncbi:fructosamine kinase [Arachnia propionica]|uniref:Fructosamine kinase n=1 Tax=Arachnia propionica TaxID=1750 RepID=A0A3P1T1I0_9ACTN|nr:fructosamine kinase family protein [Arachnia propionica]MDO5084426.1 fructosamine kinase family protein [Arachnia propionica]RRD03125.1 fructosamine kinase [Arachnia propionica]